MAEDRSLRFRFLGDSKDLERATRGANRDLDAVDKSAGKAKGGIAGLAKGFGPLIAAVGAAELGRFAWDAAQMAAQAEVAADSASKVLGPALDGLHANLEETRLTLGLNTGEVDVLAAKFGLLTEGFGLTDEAQATFIEGLITTGGELAAFRGNVGEAPAAIDALAAAIRGEFDPLEQFGIKLSQAAINEKKLELAADPATASLSDQELQIAALEALIAEKAGPAFGSLADAQNTLGGKTNAASAKFEDMKTKLGEKLLPVIIGVLDFVLASVEAWERLTDGTKFWGTALGQLVLKVKGWVEAILKPFVVTIEAIGNAIGWVGDKIASVNRAIGSAVKTAGKVGGAIGNFLGFQTGGTVPGTGPKLAVVHGGEQITNPRLGQSPGGGGNVYVTIQAGVGDPLAIAREVVAALEVYNRSSGPIPITVRSSVD